MSAIWRTSTGSRISPYRCFGLRLHSMSCRRDLKRDLPCISTFCLWSSVSVSTDRSFWAQSSRSLLCSKSPWAHRVAWQVRKVETWPPRVMPSTIRARRSWSRAAARKGGQRQSTLSCADMVTTWKSRLSTLSREVTMDLSSKTMTLCRTSTTKKRTMAESRHRTARIRWDEVLFLE